MPQSNEQLSAAELTAFLIVECNVSINLTDIQRLSLNDPLVNAILEAWRMREDRETERYAMLASVTANVAGGKTKPTDFFSPLSERNKAAIQIAKEKSLIAMFANHNRRIQAEESIYRQ